MDRVKEKYAPKDYHNKRIGFDTALQYPAASSLSYDTIL
jgi:hypothetical protein